MSSEPERPNFLESRIPSRLAPASDVTAEKYRAARLHQLFVMVVTGFGIFLGWFFWHQKWIVITIPILGVFTTPTIFGLIFYIVARQLFPRTRELKTPRLRMYPEYRRYLHASEAFVKMQKREKREGNR